MSRIIRFGVGALADVPAVARELGLERLVLVTTRRGSALRPQLPVVDAYDGVRPHVPATTVAEAATLAAHVDADGLLGLGGGSAIDTCKAVTADLLGRGRRVPTIAVPTTYAGAEWTPYFGVRDEATGRKGGGSHEDARPVAAVYDPALTLDLPRADSGGTALNALAHCAEAFYAEGRNETAGRHAFCGARTIAYALPLVLDDGANLYARTRLLEGAMRAALALDAAGLALGHAMAQALGGKYGLPHGALNALCLPAALRFNADAAPEAIRQFAEAMGVDDAAARVEELARASGFTRLRDLGVPEHELDEMAEATAIRAGAKANPRKASPADIAELLRAIW